MYRLTVAPALISTATNAEITTLSGTDDQNSPGTLPCAALAVEPPGSCPAEFCKSDDGSAIQAVQLKTGEVRRLYFTDSIPGSSGSTSKL